MTDFSTVTIWQAAKYRWWVDVILAWFLLVGIWPFADPGHDRDTLLSWVDLIVHWSAIGVLGGRWDLRRPMRETSIDALKAKVTRRD
jgi:hypothetical protein